MYLKTLEKCVLNNMSLILQNFLNPGGLAWQVAFKNTKVELDFLTDIDMLLMVEKGIRGEICHPIY